MSSTDKMLSSMCFPGFLPINSDLPRLRELPESLCPCFVLCLKTATRLTALEKCVQGMSISVLGTKQCAQQLEQGAGQLLDSQYSSKS